MKEKKVQRKDNGALFGKDKNHNFDKHMIRFEMGGECLRIEWNGLKKNQPAKFLSIVLGCLN